MAPSDSGRCTRARSSRDRLRGFSSNLAHKYHSDRRDRLPSPRNELRSQLFAQGARLRFRWTLRSPVSKEGVLLPFPDKKIIFMAGKDCGKELRADAQRTCGIRGRFDSRSGIQRRVQGGELTAVAVNRFLAANGEEATRLRWHWCRGCSLRQFRAAVEAWRSLAVIFSSSARGRFPSTGRSPDRA